MDELNSLCGQQVCITDIDTQTSGWKWTTIRTVNSTALFIVADSYLYNINWEGCCYTCYIYSEQREWDDRAHQSGLTHDSLVCSPGPYCNIRCALSRANSAFTN